MTAEEALAISNSLEAKKNVEEAKRMAEEFEAISEESRRKRVEQETKEAMRFLDPMIKEEAIQGRKRMVIHWAEYEQDNDVYDKASEIGRSKDIRYALFELGYSTCWFEYPPHDTWSLTVAWGYEESIKALSDNAEKTFSKEERQKMINVVNKRFGKPLMNFVSDNRGEETEQNSNAPVIVWGCIILVLLIIMMCTI